MKPAHILIFGDTSFNRSCIPSTLRDFESLPNVDESALSPAAAAAYSKNLEAYRLFVHELDVSMSEIKRRTGIDPTQLYRLLKKVVERHADGRIKGLRGLIPKKHQKEYTRAAAVQRSSKLQTSSAAGAMKQLLRRFSKLEKWVKKRAAERNRPLKHGEIRAVKKPIRELHREFLDECSKLGLTRDDWPFNQDYQGFRSFQTLFRNLQLEATGSSTDNPEVELPGSMPKEINATWPVALRPFTMVQFDGHKIDLRLTLSVPDPFGMETRIELHRIWILVVTDVCTRCVLGYYLALGLEYNKDDFAEALHAAIVPHRKVELKIDGLKVREGGGFPTEVQPELGYHRWTWFQFDEAKSHLAHDSLARLTTVLGSWTIAGRLGEPNDRAYQERFFGLLEQAGFHVLPGSVGSSPKDDVRKLAEVGFDLDRVITLQELEQLTYVLVANRNGEPQTGLGGRSALEAMRYLTSKPEFLLQTLPATKRHQLFLLKEATLKTVRGGKMSIPHVNFEGVRYTSDILARRRELIGKTLRIYFMARDIRTIHAYFEDGSQLGILTASRQWRTTPHSLRHRREILRLQRLKLLRWGAGDDPVEAYIKHKRGLAKQSKRAANSLAQARANIAAAQDDVALGRSPFGPQFTPQETASAPDASQPAKPASKARNKGPIVRAPMSLNKTILF